MSLPTLVPKIVHMDGGRRGRGRYRPQRKDGEAGEAGEAGKKKEKKEKQPLSIMDAPQFMTYRHITGNTEPPKNAQYNPRADELAITTQVMEQKARAAALRLQAEQNDPDFSPRSLDSIGGEAGAMIQDHLKERDAATNASRKGGFFGKKSRVKTKVLSVVRLKAGAQKGQPAAAPAPPPSDTTQIETETNETVSVESYESSEAGGEGKRAAKRGSTASKGGRSNKSKGRGRSKVMRLLLLTGARSRTKTAIRRSAAEPSIDPGILAGKNGPLLMRNVERSPSMRYKSFVRNVKQRSRSHSAGSLSRSDSEEDPLNEFGEVNVAVMPKPFAWRESTKVIMESRDAREVDLDHVLDQPKSSVVRQLFWRHLTLEMTAELLDFFDVVDALKFYCYEGRFRNLPYLASYWIWINYITDGAAAMINVSQGMRHDINAYFKGGKAVVITEEQKESKVANSFLPLDLFDDVQDEVYALMKSPFSRFKLSASFRRFWACRATVWDIRDEGAREIMEGNFAAVERSSDDRASMSTLSGPSYARPLAHREEPVLRRGSGSPLSKAHRARSSSIGNASAEQQRSQSPSPWAIGLFSEHQGLPRDSEGFPEIPREFFPDLTIMVEPFRTRSRLRKAAGLPGVAEERARSSSVRRTRDQNGSFPATDGERLSMGVMPPKPPLRHSMSTPGAKEAEELAMAAQMPPPSVVSVRPSLGGPPPAPHEQRSGFQRISAGQSDDGSYSSYSADTDVRGSAGSMRSGESHDDSRSRHILTMAEQSRPAHMRGPKENWTRSKSGSSGAASKRGGRRKQGAVF